LNSLTVRQTETRGSIVRDCPGTRHYVCCGYKTIDLVEGCPLDCSYCILKGYLNSPGISIHRDPAGIIEQIEGAVASEKEHVLRFGTGELSDSLALDRRLRLNEPIVQFFGEAKGPLLELKSKWASIDHLKSCLNPYTIVSFSLAPQAMVDAEEKRTSPIHKRLKALKEAQDSGCFVGLHFDPIIIHDGFEEDYRRLIDHIARSIDLKRVIWVSLGLLRFLPSLMKVFMRQKRRNLLAGEFIMAEDGKYRYVKAERIRIYRMLYAQLLAKEPGLFVYLCMERADVWEQVTGSRQIRQSSDLIRLFDSRIREFYGGS
jgi:spore photoproduct lyase